MHDILKGHLSQWNFAKDLNNNNIVIKLIFKGKKSIFIVIIQMQIYGVLKNDVHFDILHMTNTKMTQWHWSI